jgi:hypothetical protein
MKYRGQVVKLDLKKAIILEDARRINQRQDPINNLWRLSLEMCNHHPNDYEPEPLYKILWRAQGKGYSTHGLSKNLKPLIKHLCDLLSVKEEDLTINVIN